MRKLVPKIDESAGEIGGKITENYSNSSEQRETLLVRVIVRFEELRVREIGIPQQTDFVWLYSETNIYKLDLSFSKAPETFRVRKAIFSWSVSKNGEVYTHETSCMKRNSVHIRNVWIKPLCNRKVRNFPGLARETGPRLAKNSFCFHSLSQPNWCNLWR